MIDPKEEAVELLHHYLASANAGADFFYDHNVREEIEKLVENIIEAAVLRALQAIKAGPL